MSGITGSSVQPVSLNVPVQVYDTIAPNGCIAKAIRVSITSQAQLAIIDFTSVLMKGEIDQIQSVFWENFYASNDINIGQVLQTSVLGQTIELDAGTWGYSPLALSKPDSVTLINEGVNGDTNWQINLIFFNVHLEPYVYTIPEQSTNTTVQITDTHNNPILATEDGQVTSYNTPYYNIPQAPGQFAVTCVAATALNVPANANYALVSVEGQAVRWRDDGTAPTVSHGQLMQPGSSNYFQGKSLLQLLEFIDTAGAGATINISYYS